MPTDFTLPDGQPPSLPPTPPPKIVPSSEHPETLPLSITQKILHHYLSSPKVFETQIGGVPSARTLLEKTEAVFDSIARNGGMTEDDLSQIDTLESEIAALKDKLEEFTPERSKFPKVREAREMRLEVLNIAEKALNELKELKTSLEQTESDLVAFEEVLDRIEMATFSQQYTGEVLEFGHLLKAALEKLGHLDDKSQTKLPGTATQTLMQERIAWGAAALAFAVSEWEDEALKSIRMQRDALISAYKEATATQSTKMELLISLERHLLSLNESLADAKNRSFPYPGLEDKLSHAAAQLGKESAALTALLKREKFPLHERSLPYASEDWKTLGREHLPPPPPPSREPEEWSETTKMGMRTLFTLMQLGQQAINVGEQIEQRGTPAQKATETASKTVGWFKGFADKIGDAFNAYFGPAPLTAEQQKERDAALQQVFAQASAAKVKFDAVEKAVATQTADAGRLSEEKRSFHVLKAFMESPSHLPSGNIGLQEQPARDKLLYHIVLEHAGRLGLEGYNDFQMQSYILNLILDEIDALKSNPNIDDETIRDYLSAFVDIHREDATLDSLEKIKDTIKHSLRLGNALARKPFEVFHRSFTEDVQRLQPGDSFFFMTSWNVGSTGHTIGYEVIKLENGLYAFRIYNQGSGAENHDSTIKDNYLSYLPFAEVVDVEQAKLTDPIFVGGLRDLAFEPRNVPGVWEPDDFYHHLFPFLGGKANHQLYTPDHGMRAIYQGICTFSTLAAHLNTRSDLRTFNRRFITWKVKTFKDYHAKMKPQLERNEQARKLIQLSLQQIARDLVNAKELNLFTDKEITLFNAYLSSAEADLKKAESNYLSHLSQQAPTVSFDRTSTLTVEGIQLPKMPSIVSSGKTDFTGNELPVLPRFLKAIDGSWQYNPKTFTSELENVLEEVDAIIAKYPRVTQINSELSLEFEPVVRRLETMISKLPMEGENVFWKNMSPSEAEKALELIQKLSFDYFKSWGRLKYGISGWKGIKIINHLDTQRHIATMKLLGVADSLAKSFKDAWGFEFPHLYQQSMDWFLFDKFIDAEIDDPEWKEQRQQIKDYWAKVKSDEGITEATPTFFDLEGMGMGGNEVRTFSPRPDTLHERIEENMEDLTFAKNWAMRPEVIEKMPKEIASLPVRLRALYLLENGEMVKECALPPAFFAMRNISRVLFYENEGSKCDSSESEYGACFGEVQKLTPPDDRSPDWRLEKIFSRTYISSIQVYRDRNYIARHNPVGRMKHEETEVENLKRIYMIERDFSNHGRSWGGASYAEETRRLRPSHRLLTKQVQASRFKIIKIEGVPHLKAGSSPDSIGLSMNTLEVSSSENKERTQMVLSLRGNEAVQIRETLAFAKANPQFIKYSQVRYLIKVLLNEGALFINEIKTNTPETAQFINEAAHFLETQTRLASIISDFDTLIDLAEINSKLSSQLDYVMEKYPGSPQPGFKNPFYNSRSTLRELLIHPDVTTNQKKNIHILLSSVPQHVETLDVETAVDLMKATLFLDKHGLPERFEKDQFFDGFDYLLSTPRATHLLRSSMEIPELRNRILNAAVKSIEPHFIDTTWSEAPSYPYYSTDDGRFSLNVNKGTIDLGSDTLRPFTFEGRNDPLVKLVLGDADNVQASRDQKGVIRFLDLEGSECIYQKSGTNKGTLIKHVGDRWFQAFDASDVFSLLPSKNLLKKDSIIWIERTPEGEIVKASVTVPLEHDIDHTCRIEIESGGKSGRLRILGIHRTDKSGNDTGEVLANLQKRDSPYRFLDNFEERNHVRIWEDQTSHEPRRIELPRFGLNFDIERRGDGLTAVSDNYPGYRIANHQFVPALGDYDNFILLENDRGEKKVLLPIVDLIRPNAPLQTSSAFKFPKKGDDVRLRFTTHSINQGAIIPETTEGRFHLAQILLWERRYSEAMHTLRGDRSQLNPLSDGEKTQLDALLNLDNLNLDNSPEATAIRVYAHYLLKRDAIDFGKGVYAIETLNDDDPEKMKYLRTIELYRQKSDQISFVSLMKHEKEFLYGDAGLTAEEQPLSSAVRAIEGVKRKNIKETLNSTLGSVHIDFPKRWKSAQQGTPLPSFMRAPIARYFKEIFSVVREGIYCPGDAEVFRNVTGYDLPNQDNPEAMKEAFKQLIRINEDVNLPDQCIPSMILEAVLVNPSEYADIPLFSTEDTLIFDPKNVDNLDQEIFHNIVGRSRSFVEERIDSLVDREKVAATIIALEEQAPLISRTDTFPLSPKIKRVPQLTPMHQMSVSLQEEEKLTFTGVEGIENYFKWVPYTPEGKLEELNRVFTDKTSDPNFNSMLDNTASQVKEMGEKRVLTRGHYELISMEKLLELKSLLKERYDAHTSSVAFLEKGILELANKPFEDQRLQADRENSIRGGYDEPLSLEKLLHLFYTRDMEAIANKNRALTPKEIESLFGEIKLLLEETKASQHQKRMLDDIAEIEKNPEPDELQAINDRLVHSMKANTQYSTSEHPEYLVLEVVYNIIMRKEQVDVVEALFKSGAAIELEPSFGKTSTVRPTLARRDANGKNLVATVMPDPLMGSMAPAAQAVESKAYGSKIEPMRFDKSTKYTAPFLQRIKDRLYYIIENKEVLYIVDGSIKNFYLSFIDTTLKGDMTNPETARVIDLFGEIFALTRSAAIVNLDEGDQILAPLKSHHFTFSEPRPIHPQKLTTSVAVFAYLLNNSFIQEKIKLPFLHEQEASPFTEARFDEEIKPMLIQGFMNGEIFSDNEVIRSFIDSLSIDEKEMVKNYLRQIKSPEGDAFIASIQSRIVKNTLATLKEHFNSILKLTLNRNLGEHFGPRPPDLKGSDSDEFLSIPYKGSNDPAVNRDPVSQEPVSNSEHGTDLELISYTTIMNLIRDLPKELILKEISFLQAKAKKEIAKKKVPSLQKTEAYRAMKAIAPGIKDTNLLSLTPDEITEIVAAVNQSPHIKLKLIEKYILSNMRSYEKELSCGGQIYAFLFRQIKAYSGTLWNSEAFPLMFDAIIKSETMAKIINILWENSPHAIRTFTPSQEKGTQEEKVEAMVKALYTSGEGFKGAFIDAGAYFREFEDNKLVAKAILEHSPDKFEGIDYFGPNGEVLFLQRGSDQGIPIALCTVPESKRTAYFDQIHTTGADLKLGASMTGTVSISRHNIMRDIIQAVGRFRQIDKGQRVDFVVGAEDLDVIRDAIESITKRKLGETLELGDLLIYALHAESMKKGDDNIRALNSEFEGVFRELHMEVISDPTVPAAEKKAVTEALESLLVETKAIEPFEEYGDVLESMPREEVVEDTINKWLNGPVMKAIESHPLLVNRSSREKIEDKLRKIAAIKMPYLPVQFTPSSAYGKEILKMVETKKSVQINVDIQSETQEEMMTQQNVVKETMNADYTEPRPTFQWDQSRLFDWEAYQPVSIEEIKGETFGAITGRHIPSIVSFGSVLGDDPYTSKYKAVFSPNILSSLNLMPVHRPDNLNQLVYHPFGVYHDFINWALFVQNKATGEYKMILCNQDDAEQFMSMLEKDSKNPAEGKRTAKAFLYHFGLDNGIVAQGRDRVDSKQLHADPDFVSLLTQGKFLNGALNYDDQEKKVLAKWAGQHGEGEMRNLFLSVILAYRESIRSRFESSDISDVL